MFYSLEDVIVGFRTDLAVLTIEQSVLLEKLLV